MYFEKTVKRQTSRHTQIVRRSHWRSARFKAFSFIEVMVVVVIIGLLAGAVVLKVDGYMRTAKQNRAKSDIATIVASIEAYYLNNNRYPTNEEGLEKLPLTNRMDPWGKAYEYNSPGRQGPFEVLTLGEDGREGGVGADADLYSWQLGEQQKEN